MKKSPLFESSSGVNGDSVETNGSNDEHLAEENDSQHVSQSALVTVVNQEALVSTQQEE